jgi:hypothetical protein
MVGCSLVCADGVGSAAKTVALNKTVAIKAVEFSIFFMFFSFVYYQYHNRYNYGYGKKKSTVV